MITLTFSGPPKPDAKTIYVDGIVDPGNIYSVLSYISDPQIRWRPKVCKVASAKIAWDDMCPTRAPIIVLRKLSNLT